MDNWLLNITPIRIPRPKRVDKVLKKCECCFFIYTKSFRSSSIQQKILNTRDILSSSNDRSFATS